MPKIIHQKDFIMTTNVSTTVFNEAQIQLLDMMSFVKKEETLTSLRQVISDYFAKEADKELDKLWDNGSLNDEKIESFKNLHERTPYRM